MTKDRGEKLAVEYGIKFVETSAKASINVEEAFFTLASDIKAKMEKRMVCLIFYWDFFLIFFFFVISNRLFITKRANVQFQEVNNPPKGGAHKIHQTDQRKKPDSWLSRCSLL